MELSVVLKEQWALTELSSALSVGKTWHIFSFTFIYLYSTFRMEFFFSSYSSPPPLIVGLFTN